MKYPVSWKIISFFLRSFVRKYHGLENINHNQAYIFAVNHIGLIDSPLVISILLKKLNHPVHFLGKTELFKRYSNFIAKNFLKMIPVSFANPSQSLIEAQRVLENNESVGIYPEGGRNTASLLLKGKTGAVRLALTSKKPIIPIGYSGPHPINNTLDSFWLDIKSFFVNPQPVIINIGKPLYFDKYSDQPITKELLDKLTRIVMQEIGKLCHKKYPF